MECRGKKERQKACDDMDREGTSSRIRDTITRTACSYDRITRNSQRIHPDLNVHEVKLKFFILRNISIVV